MKRYLVYFWETEDQQSVKIGHCQGNLYKRREGINNGCPHPLCKYPIGVIVCENKEDMLKVEKTNQRQFKAHRTNGEWFELVDEMSEYIREFTDTESGKSFVEEGRKDKHKHDRERRKDPEAREYQQEYQRERSKDPEHMERERERNRKRSKDPKVREHNRERRKDPKVRERNRKRNREYRKDPEVRERHNKQNREYRVRKKREKQSINGQQLELF